MQEKRHHPRKPVKLSVEIQLEGRPEREAGECQDLSLGGGYVATPLRAAFGKRLRLRLNTGHGWIEIDALVRWTGADGIGLQFGAMGARETHAITELIREGHH